MLSGVGEHLESLRGDRGRGCRKHDHAGPLLSVEAEPTAKAAGAAVVPGDLVAPVLETGAETGDASARLGHPRGGGELVASTQSFAQPGGELAFNDSPNGVEMGLWALVAGVAATALAMVLRAMTPTPAPWIRPRLWPE